MHARLRLSQEHGLSKYPFDCADRPSLGQVATAANPSRNRSLSRTTDGICPAEESEWFVDRAERSAALAKRVGRPFVRRHRPEIATPSRECERGTGDGAVAFELRLDGGNKEVGELGRPVDAKSGDLVAHPSVVESLENGCRICRGRAWPGIWSGRHGLEREERFEVSPDHGYRDCLVDVANPCERQEALGPWAGMKREGGLDAAKSRGSLRPPERRLRPGGVTTSEVG